jgi:iron complex transport system substrate-binding protein
MNNYFNKIIKNNRLILILGIGLTSLFVYVTTYNQRDKSGDACLAAGKTAPSRIASTSLASDEILVRLLKEAGQLDRLVAVSTLVDNPVYSHVASTLDFNRARIGENLESIASLKPDLVVFASFNRPAITASLGQIAVKTCWLEKFTSLADIHRNILTLGAAAGVPETGRKIADEFLADLQAAERDTKILVGDGDTAGTRKGDKRERPRVLSFDGSGTVMAGGTTFDELVNLAGGVNAATIAGLKGWPKPGAESLASMAPDVIVLLTDTRSKNELVELLHKTPGWRDTPAVKRERFVAPRPADLLALSPDVISSVPVMRAAFLADGVP